MTARNHPMPFGARCTRDGVSFRLWAPGCRQVGLCLGTAADGPALAMAGLGGGWFGLTVAGAGAGTRYRFQIDGGLRVPDPASRFNPDDVHGASEVIDPEAFPWEDDAWAGRPWPEAVVYELHVGAFSPEGSFDGVARRLDYLADLGVTAIELMPVADFPGARNWGYDGVLPFAPDSRYGRPERLKALVQAAHRKGLMVFLDVVYNHFGPEGNYLHAYADRFFDPRRQTPWGPAIRFDGPESGTVREFFLHNALYWLEEYHLDGLRLDAVHAIFDGSGQHLLDQLAERVRTAMGPRAHLILENDANQACRLGPGRGTAQWNDDCHHALHVLCTGEADGYYADYADPAGHLGRCLAEGFAYQGELSRFRGGAPRGEPSAQLPPQAFVSFLQCHDQVGNRAFGERITALAPEPAVRAAAATFLLAPAIPMLFMGEEFGAATPFLYFCDFQGELGAAVAAGRRREFGQFARFAQPDALAALPDPGLEQTFARSRLDWDSLESPVQARWLAFYRDLLGIRRRAIVPRLGGMAGHRGWFERIGPAGLRVAWLLGDGARLELLANFSEATVRAEPPAGTSLFASAPEAAAGVLGPWAVAWTLDAP